jgi:hypothetical protein
VGDVGGAAKTVLVMVEVHDGHRRFRRDAIDAPHQKVIEHDVADDGDGLARELLDEVCQRRRHHATRRSRSRIASAR